MSTFPIIAIIIGFLLMLAFFLWLRQERWQEAQPSSAGLRRFTTDGNQLTGTASIITTPHGALLHINPVARQWLGLADEQPDFEDVLRRVSPREHLYSLLEAESRTSFQMRDRWVEATSHYLPEEGGRIMVVMREMRGASEAVSANGSHAPDTQDKNVLDVSLAIRIVGEIGETVNAGMGLEPALQVVLEIILRGVTSDAGEICLWDRRQEFLEQRGWTGDTRYLLTIAQQGGGYEVGVGVAGWMIQHDRPVLISNAGDELALRVLLDDTPYHSAVGIPLTLGDELIGTLTLFGETGGIFGDGDLALLQSINKVVATSIRNAQLYSEQEQRIRDIANLQTITEQPKDSADVSPVFDSLSKRMASLVDADMCGVYLYDEARNALVPQMPFFGLPDHVAERIVIPLPPQSPQREIWENQPYWVANDVIDEPLVDALDLKPILELAGIENAALFPMQVGGERIGLIAISNKRGDAGFLPADIQNLRVLSTQAAILVENVRLFQRERRLDTEHMGLQEMTHAIGALDHQGEFYGEITSRIARLMDSEMCGILLYNDITDRLEAQLPFTGVADDLIRDYAIDLPAGSVQESLWQEEDFWMSDRVLSDTLVFETGLDQLAERVGIRTTLVAVMTAGGRRIGVVQVSNKHNNERYNDRDARLLQIFATQAGAIVENARLYREIQVRAEQSEKLRRIAEQASRTISSEESFRPVLREIADFFDSQVAFINIVDPSANVLITYPRWTYGVEIAEPMRQDLDAPGYEYAPAVSGRPYFSNDVMQDESVLPGYRRIARAANLNSAMLVPLRVGDRILGEIGIANSRGVGYTEGDVLTFGTIAAQIASSVERLLLFEETGENLRRRVEELDSIARVSNELTLTRKLDAVLDVIREEAIKATYADNSTIVMLRPKEEWRVVDVPKVDHRIGEIAGLYSFAPIEMRSIERGADPIVVNDYAAESGDLDAQPENARSAVAVAFFYLDEIVGVVHIWHESPNIFDERAANFLLTLSNKAALAYQNALLYEQQQERGERLRQRVDQLNRIFELGQMIQTNTDPVMVLEAIAYSVQQSVGYDTVLMVMYDEDEDAYRRVAHAGMPLEAFRVTQDRRITPEQLDQVLKEEYRTSETYFFPVEKFRDWYQPAVNVLSTAFEEKRSLEAPGQRFWHDGDLLVVTIVGQGGNLLGLMSLDRPYDNRRPARGTIEVLEIFGHQAASMIENTRLFRESERSAKQEARLNDVLESIASTLDISEISESLAEGLRGMVPLDRMTLVIFIEQDDMYEYMRVNFDEHGYPEVSQSRQATLERTALGEVFSEGRLIVYNAEQAKKQPYDDLRSWVQQGEQSIILLPLTAGGQQLGVLHLGSETPGVFEDPDVKSLLSRAARLIAGTVQNARLFNQAVNLQILNRSVVESIQQGIVTLDNSGRIININEFMRERYQWSEAEARGKDLFTYRPNLQDALQDDLRGVLVDGVVAERIQETTLGPDGTPIVRNFYIYPLRFRNQIRGAVLLVEDLTERIALEEAIEHRANQLAALTEVSTRITASLERDEVIELALGEMGWIIRYDTMSIWRRNGSFMNLEGARGYHDDHLHEELTRVPLNDYELIMRMTDSQRAVVAEQVGAIPLLLPGDEHNQSWMGVPLVNQGHVVGMMLLGRHDEHAYDAQQERNVAFAFASQVAIALANADLFMQTFERTDELSTLLEAARTTSLTRNLNEVFQNVAELMFSALEMEDCTIMIWYEVHDELEVQYSGTRTNDPSRIVPKNTRYPIRDYPAREQALLNREVVVIIDTQDDRVPPFPYELEEMRANGRGSRMLVPLVVRDESIGLIQLEQESNAEDAISQRKVQLARALGSQVAVNVENARLTNEASNFLEELMTINQLSQSISSALRLEDMLPIIQYQVPQVTNAEEMYLALYDAETQRITFPLAVREDGVEFVIPARQLNDDEVSYIIKRKDSLNLGAPPLDIDIWRRSIGVTNGEGDIFSYTGVPLRSGDEVFGVLAIRNIQRKRYFDLNDDRILSTVGSQLSAAIQNARLFEQVQNSAENLEKLVQDRTDELEEERDRLDTLYQITSELARTLDMDQLLERSLSMVSKAVGADDGVILLSDPATDALYSRKWINPSNIITQEESMRTHPAEGLANWLIYHDDTAEGVVVVDDLNDEAYWDERGRKTGLRSALAVRLENNEDPMGVMVLLSDQPGAFTETHLKLLVPAATQVAAAINSADLYKLIRDQAEKMGRVMRSEQEEAQKHSAIVEGITDGVMLVDSNGKIVLFNAAAERILNVRRYEVMDQPLSRFSGIYGATASYWPQLLNDWSDTMDSDEDQLVTERVEIGSRIINTQLSPVYIGDLFLGMVAVFRDVTKDVEADRAKSKFIENVSHEFRTPLTPIKGYTDILLMTSDDSLDETKRKMIETIRANTERLVTLVDDVLRISKLESGEDDLHFVMVDVGEMIPVVVGEIQQEPRIRKKTLTTHLDIEPQLPSIRADREKIRAVLYNIIDNAYKYTESGGTIRVNAQRSQDHETILVTVQDTGVGIAEEFQAVMWNRFERYDQHAVELDVAGTGLGLSLAKEVVNLHNGDIWFESELGVGTTFFIRLPMEQPAFQTRTVELPQADETTLAGD